MRQVGSALGSALCIGLALLVSGSTGSHARDFGQLGQTFPIVEADLLATIEARLRRAEASGELARVNAAFAERAKAKVRRPTPVPGITLATENRRWEFDPTMTVERDIRDQKNNLIAAAGQKVNPLDFVALRQALIFIDGDDPAQLDWATRSYADGQAKIIFVDGSPFDAMGARKRRFYFDQEGRLTRRFGISHVPASVTQGGKILVIAEHVLKGRGS